jgi:predicted HicB family RNase H-like nuclease
MSTMTYKNYSARIEFDERDNIFVGRILGIRDIISFHGSSVTDLRAEFERTVEDYLADCAERGVSPEKAASGNLMLRVGAEIHGRAIVAAEGAGKSLNQWVIATLEEALHS